MVFNSIPFVLFFVVVFFVYWLLLKRNTKAQNVFLLVASYFFYGYADWKMLPLLMVSTVVFYFLGIGIGRAKTERAASWLKVLGVVLGVGVLLYFKYLNFFIDSFSRLFESMGLHTNWHTFNIVMPVGVSFFTFKLISYVLDIHSGEIEPTRDVVDFATYIAFFPCILSGPIDRPRFISQLEQKREFDYNQAIDGMRQILWGLFKKIVVADNCAVFVDNVFSTYTNQKGSTLFLAIVFYSFQLYADFSGYSDMAIGVGKLLGFRITRNFNHPFFALNVADFWRRWHMSLTSWVTDYVFTPLNFQFRRWGKVGMILAIIINMVVVGLWHEANWTYVLFGVYHGLLFVPLVLSGVFMKKDQLRTNRIGLPVLKDFFRILLTFGLVLIGWIIVRSDSIGMAWEYVCGMLQSDTFMACYRFFKRPALWPTNLFIVIMLVVEWLQREKEHGLEMKNEKRYKFFRWSMYLLLTLAIFLFQSQDTTQFIYFQF
jgi:D-alanyl-lipoteichoic acid acyltransferase DltB (MBOAT superfamily)